MYQSSILLAFCCILSLTQAASLNAKFLDEKTRTPWNISEAIYAGSKIRGFNGNWISDTEFYYKAPDNALLVFNADQQITIELLPKGALQIYGSSTLTLSPDNTRILVRYAVESIFRHSIVAKYDIYDLESRTATQIHSNAKLQYCQWSPTGDKVAYVYQNNVYVHNVATNTGTQLTIDGENGIIYNGVPDWVYEEEVLGTGSAIWWSPDGQKLAIGYFDDRDVQTFKYFLYGESDNPEYQYPKEVDLKYPKPGTPNPRVALKVIDLNDVPKGWINLPAPTDVVSHDHILQEVTWSDKDRVLVTWLNRRQNKAALQSCDYHGSCRQVTSLEEPNGWISLGDPQCLSNGKNCIFANWIGNWYQIWNLDLETGKNGQSALGNFTVQKVYGYDEVNKVLYYQATLEDDPAQYHVFGNKECLSCTIKDVDDALCRQASATFSKGFSYFSLTCTGPNPSYTSIRETKTNSQVKLWEANTPFREMLSEKLRPTIKFLEVPLGGSFKGIAKLFLPPGLNWDDPDPKKKYALIVNVYGGPNSVRVTNQFTVGWEGYLTTTRNVIYAIIDGRGTGNKGKDLLFTVNNKLGTVEIEDQISVTKYLQKTYSFIDAERCGIWGWSYGGYVTAMTVAKDTDRVFQCGISVAPVTAWYYYDTIYTERYMGLPSETDNLINYKLSDIMGNVENFRNHDFLLMHGSGDDNVHVQQSMMLAKELQKKDIVFEEMTYTDENHSIGNFLMHLYHTQDHFWTNCLNLDIDGDEHSERK